MLFKKDHIAKDIQESIQKWTSIKHIWTKNLNIHRSAAIQSESKKVFSLTRKFWINF